MRFWLTDVVYNCPICRYDHTIRHRRVKDIRRTIEMNCPNRDCPSNTGEWDDWVEKYHSGDSSPSARSKD